MKSNSGLCIFNTIGILTAGGNSNRVKLRNAIMDEEEIGNQYLRLMFPCLAPKLLQDIN